MSVPKGIAQATVVHISSTANVIKVLPQDKKYDCTNCSQLYCFVGDSSWNVLNGILQKLYLEYNRQRFMSRFVYRSKFSASGFPTVFHSMLEPGPPLLSWFNFIPEWISNYIHYKVWGWNYSSIPQPQRLYHWSLRMDKWFHPTLYWTRDYLSMLGLRLMLVSKRG